MANYKPLGVPFDRTFRNDLNFNFGVIDGVAAVAKTKADKAEVDSTSALSTADEAKATADSTQTQLNNVIIESGTSDAEVIQARGTAPVLNERLNEVDAVLEQKAPQSALDKTNQSLDKQINNIQKVSKLIAPLKAIEKFDDDLFNFEYTKGIKVINSAVTGVKQLTIDSTAVEPNHTNAAIYDAIGNVRGFEVEFEPGINGKNVKLGFGNDINNFVFINLLTGDMLRVMNGELSVGQLNSDVIATTLSDGDKIKLIAQGSNVQYFKNNVLVNTIIMHPSFAYKAIPDLDKYYPVISFRDGTGATSIYGVTKVKIFQKTYPKFMHLSIDDEIPTLQLLTEQLPTSIFDISNFAFLKYLHDSYGAVFTLNLFYKYTPTSTFNLSQVTANYIDEFRENADWLKFSFHGYDSTIDYSTLDSVTAKTHWDTVMAEIARFAGATSIDTMPRTSMFKGNLANCRAWRDTEKYNATGFLSADDNRANNLYLGTKENTSLVACDDLYDSVENLYFMRTDLRMDAAQEPYDILESRKSDANYVGQQNAQIVFWHSSNVYYDNPRYNAEECCKWARDNGYVFDFPMNVNPKF